MTTSDTFLVGAARADITPALGIQLAGDIGRLRPTEEIRDRLYASALVVRAGDRQLCLVVLDLLALDNDWCARLRERLHQRFGLAPADIVFHCVQNHAAPCVGHFFVKASCTLMPPEYPWLRGGDERYNEPTAAAIEQAVGQALASLAPATLHTTRGIDGRVAFNRRYVLRDGTSRMGGPLAAPDLLRSEGPTDPEVGIATFTNPAGEVVACLLHFTSHPCHGYPQRIVIGDWPGAWAERMRAHFGPQCVPLVVNGCCGNVIHQNALDPDWRSHYQDMAAKLTETALRALPRRVPQPPTLGAARTILRLPLRQLAAAEVAKAQALIAAHPEPIWLDAERTRANWDWVYAVATLDLADTIAQDPTCPYEIQAWHLGDLALVALMGEPFVEGQLRLKEHSPFPYTFVAHFCHGYAGYLPTPEAMRRGGYETRTANWSKFAPDALDTVIDQAQALLQQLRP